MIVWGGYGPSFSVVGTGSLYDPKTDTWRPMSMVGAGGPRGGHTTVWTGTEMLVWGGFENWTWPSPGRRYDPRTDEWRLMSSGGQRPPQEGHSAVWTGSEMIVWGGCCAPNTPLEDNLLQSGARYDPATDQWAPLSEVNVPRAREGHGAVWTGREMLIFGGLFRDCEAPDGPCSGLPTNTGGLYDPAADSWRPMSTQGAPYDWYAREILAGDFVVAYGGGRYVVNAQPDGDGDGVPICDGDCDDEDPEVYPGAVETCDGVDNDCDGSIDEGTLHVLVKRTRAGSRNGMRALTGPLAGAVVFVYDGSRGACPAQTCGLPASHDYACPLSGCTALHAGYADDQGKIAFELPAGDYVLMALDEQWRATGGRAPRLGCASERNAAIRVTEVGDELRPGPREMPPRSP